MDNKVLREKEIHNNRFSNEVRESAWKYYAIDRNSIEFFYNQILADITGKQELEIGCGKGDRVLKISKRGAFITGIDISEVAVKAAIEKLKKDDSHSDVKFQVINAEELEFGDEQFNIIYDAAILHHLDLKKTLQHLVKVLNKSGKAVFVEPLGHNPIINLYRKLTPKLRTEDEHPLIASDLKLLREYFNNVKIHYFHLTTLLAVPFRNTVVFNKLLSLLESIDKLLFCIPLSRNQA